MKYLKIITILATCNICIYASGISRPTYAVAAPAAQQEQAAHTITWSTPTGTTTTTVTPGSPVVLPIIVPVSCDESYPAFVGWFTAPAGENGSVSSSKPAEQVTANTYPTGNATYYAVFSNASDDGDWTLVEDASSLSVGDTIIIAAQDYSKAMSTTQNTNNRGVADVTKNGSTLSFTESAGVQVLTLKEGIFSGTWSFYTGSGYLYAASSKSNHLKTETTQSANSSWSVTITDSKCTIQAQGTNTNNLLQYNASFNAFSCYSPSTSTQKAVVLYRKHSSATGYISSCCNNHAEVSVTPAASTIYLDATGEAVTTIHCTQQGGHDGEWTYSVSPSTATFDGATFCATETGTYTLTATFTEDNCSQSGTATIIVISPEYPLMLCDRGSLTETGKYEAGEMIPKPSSPTGVCTDYIHYTFDGWATTAVADSSTTYTPVSFPYAMPAGGATLYAVYRHAAEHSDKPFVLTTDIPRASDSVIIAAQSTTGDWYALQAAKENTATPLAVTDNIATPATQAFLLVSAEDNTLMLKTAGNNYVHINSTSLNIASSAINASFTLTADNGMFYLTRSDQQRWMSVTPSANGVSFGSTATPVTTGNFYIFRKEQPASFFTTTPVCGRISTTMWQDDGIHIATSINVSGADLYAENQGQTTIVRDIATGRNTDGTYTIPIPEINAKPCSHLQLTLKKGDYILAQCTQRVPIIVSGNTTTADAAYFRKGLTVDSCKQCDIIVHEGVLLEHTSDSLTQFNSMDIYAGGQLRIDHSHLTLNELRLHATNDNVSYAILNNSGDADASISVRHVVHIKHIDGHYWYPFSLPYDCRIADICQVGGQPIGTFGTDWGIKFYDGQRRQSDGNSTTPAGEVSQYWTMMDANATLEAYQGYIIGLFGSDEDEMKSICFPPASTSNYTESADAKTTPIRNWSDNLTSEPRHHGWNFIGSPYISLFGSTEDGDGPNNTHSLRMDYTHAEGETAGTDHVLVSIPDPGDANTYTQAPATATAIKPFMAYFVQAFDPTDGASHTLDLTYSKANRSLPEAMPRRTPAEDSLQNIYIELNISNGTSRDNAGIQVSPAYSADYEIGFDLIKMYAAASKPQLFTRDAANNKMAYLALPDEHAHHIPLGLYAPSAGDYTLSVHSASQLSAAGAVYLLHQNHIVANLLQSDYSIHAPARGLVPDYSLDIRRVPDTTTNAEPANASAPHIVILHRTLMIDNLPADAAVQVYDILGHLILSTNATSAVMSVPVNAPGVYTVCITTDKSRFITKVIIR